MSLLAQALPHSIATSNNNANAGHNAPSAVYRALSHGVPVGNDRAMARAFLEHQLQQARLLSSDLPGNTADMETWIGERSEAIGAEYNAYLKQRRDGAPRRYFTTKALSLIHI